MASWEPAPRDIGRGFFAYDFPHDHDFNLYTLGFLGPGYKTTVYSYDQFATLGIPNEQVEITSLGDFQLGEGVVFLYERSKDIHVQHPPEALSASLNIMQNVSAFPEKPRQYQFDINEKKIVSRINKSRVDQLISIAAKMAPDSLREIALQSPDITVRAAAHFALIKEGHTDLAELGMRDDIYVREIINLSVNH